MDGAMTNEQIAKRVVDGIEERLGNPLDNGLRLYCVTCAEFLDGNPLDADGMVVLMLIHAFAAHRLVVREAEAATVRREVSA